VVNFLSSWVKNLCLALIVVSILEMLLPNNKTKKYIKMVMGLYVLFSIIAPFIENKDELKVDVENLYGQYKVQTSEVTDKTDQTSMDNRLNELYKQKLEKDIIQKVNDEGYSVEECHVDAHVVNNDTGIELITLKLKEKLAEDENINSTDNNSINSSDTIENTLVKEIQKIEIGGLSNKTTENVPNLENTGNIQMTQENKNITKTDINKVKKLLKKEYGVSEKCLKIS